MKRGAGGDACGRGRGHGMSGKGLGHMAGEVPQPRLLGKLGPLGKMGEPTPPCWGGDVSPSCVAQWAPSGCCSVRGATPGSPETAPLPKCSSLVLPRAACCPPHPRLPLLSHPPRPPRGLGICVNATSSSSCPLGKPLGCPEAQCFHLYNGTPPRQHHGRCFWGVTGQGQCTPAQYPEHRGVPETACPASPGVLAPCWVGKGGTGTQGDTRRDPDVCGSACDGDSEEEGQVGWV